MMIEARPYPADISTLTTLRFFAALIVIIHHFGYFMPFPVQDYTMLFRKGYLAVDFFFILSGFILVHAYTESFLKGQFNRRVFLLRRFARLYPVHAITLALMAVIGPTNLHFGPVREWPGTYPWELLVHNILLIQGWGVDDFLGFNMPSWSISAEWFAYLLFPFLLPLCLRLKPTLFLSLAIITYTVMWFVSWGLDPVRPMTRLTNDFSILRIMPAFLLGMALYRYRSMCAPYKLAARGALACAFLALAVMHGGHPDILVIPCFALIIIWTADLARMDKPVWCSRPFYVWLGEISYSLYMVHYPLMVIILYSARQYMSVESYQQIFIPLAVLTLCVSIVMAALLYHRVELPARLWMRNLTNKSAAPPQ